MPQRSVKPTLAACLLRAAAARLPLPRDSADELALRAHIALAALRRGQGGLSDLHKLSQALQLVALLAQRALDPDVGERARRALEGCCAEGRQRGVWALADWQAVAEVVTLYDLLLHDTPKHVLRDAVAHLASARDETLP
jgi:hypothetical protein